MTRKKVYRLSESELTNLIRKIIFEQEELKNQNPLESCLDTLFEIKDEKKVPSCLSLNDSDVETTELKKCGEEICRAIGKNCTNGEIIQKLDDLVNCLGEKKNLTEQTTDTFQTQREQEIENNFCSVDEKGLIQFSGKFKGKKWEEFLCTMDIQPKEIQNFVASADTECAKGKVVNYFKGFEDIKKLTDEINRIKTTFPSPPGKEPRELRNEMLKGIKKFLDNKTVQFYSDFENKNKSFVGYIRKVEMNTPGKFELTINKYDPTTKKILDWGEGYVLNSKKPRIFEYHCCEYQNDDNCDDNLIPLEGTDTRGFTPQEMYLCNRAVENIMNEFCTQKKDEPKAPYFGQTQSSPSQLTEDTNPDKPRLFGPRANLDELKKEYCVSDGVNVSYGTVQSYSDDNVITKEESEEIKKNCPDRPIAKIPNFGVDEERRMKEFEYWWCSVFLETITNKYIVKKRRGKMSLDELIDKYGITESEVKTMSQRCPESVLAKLYVSGEYQKSPVTQATPSDDKKDVPAPTGNDGANKPAPPPNDDKTNQAAPTEDPEEELGAKVLVGKTAGFYDRKSKLGRGRIQDIKIMTDENENKIFNKLEIVVTNIDGNNNEIPKGNNITNTKTILFDCNNDSMMIYRDENNRQYPPGYVYTNRELVKVLKNGYCANVKRAKLDYPGGPRFRR